MKIIRHVRRGEMVPPWYGVAWIDWQTDVAAALPVPLNWVVALARKAWGFVRFGSVAVARDPRDAYRQGVEAGKSAVQNQR